MELGDRFFAKLYFLISEKIISFVIRTVYFQFPLRSEQIQGAKLIFSMVFLTERPFVWVT